MNAAQLCPSLVAGVFCLVCARSAGAAGTGNLTQVLLKNGYRAVPLQHSNSKGFTLAAKINGNPTRLAVSMASPLSAVFRGPAARFAIRERKSGGHLNSALGPSKEEYGLASNSSIEVANMVMPATTFVVLDQTNTAATQWRDTVGFFGEAELYRLAAVLDCGNSRLYLRPAGRDPVINGAIREALTAHGFTSVPMKINPVHHFEVPCRINGFQSVITIEPVNSLTVISTRTAASGRVPTAETSDTLIGVGGVRRPAKNGQVTELGIGTFMIPKARVSVADTSIDVLGFDQLGRCAAVIDLGARTLYLHGRPIRAGN